MAPTPLTLGGQEVDGGEAVGRRCRRAVLDRTVFFHHATGTANHGELGRVLQLFGALRRGQWLPAYFAKSLRSCFNTVQAQPVTIGGEQLSFDGQYLPKLTPTGSRRSCPRRRTCRPRCRRCATTR